MKITDLIDSTDLSRLGTSFGNYTRLDVRGLPIMAETPQSVIFDASHSMQQPGGRGESLGSDLVARQIDFDALAKRT